LGSTWPSLLEGQGWLPLSEQPWWSQCCECLDPSTVHVIQCISRKQIYTVTATRFCNLVALCFSHFSHCVFCGSFNLASVSLISSKCSTWKSVCSPKTPAGGSGVVRRQFGQVRVCPLRSWTTRRSRHFLQKEWKHGSNLASVYVSRQTEHSSWVVILFSAFSATLGGWSILCCYGNG